MQQEAGIEYLRGSKLHLSGDGRCDVLDIVLSKVHLLLRDYAKKLILDYSLVQVTDTGSSVAMEKEGLRRFLD